MRLIQIFIISLIILPTVKANEVYELLKADQGTTNNYPRVVKKLVDEGLYYTAIPYIKEFLFKQDGAKAKIMDELIDEVVTEVGVKQFEVLPNQFLRKSNAPILKYILARKQLRRNKYQDALDSINGTIPREHSVKPYALHLEGVIFSITGKTANAIQAFKECQSVSESRMGKTNDTDRRKQLKINRDLCLVGVARSMFGASSFDKANSAYLDLSKDSPIWPQILFEEAWNSFYQRDYNRTLGKLVTYKAPILSFYFNPEVDILKALTYMELCLWDDTNRVVDEFYSSLSDDAQGLQGFLAKHGKDYKYYYLLAKTRSKGRIRGNKLINQLVYSVTRDPSYQEQYAHFLKGKDELEIIGRVSHKRLKSILASNLKDSLLLQRDLIGAYVRKRLYIYQDSLEKTFTDMSYIKLEVLDRKKKSLYQPDYNMNRGRGDIQNLVRTDKQYFWTFNGEFWADELGDYVFSLKSECTE